MNSKLTRRDFLRNTSIASGALMASGFLSAPRVFGAVDMTTKPAILGGAKVGCAPSPAWPPIHGTELEMLENVLNSRHWCRSGDPECLTNNFEKAYADYCGAKHCIAVNSGTSSLITSLAALEVGPGDEVITSPYTYVATINCIIAHYGLPVLADVDLESFQVCPKMTEKMITPNTKVLIPVHIGGAPAKMDGFMDVAARHGNLPIVEDACQAHFGKWGDKYLGSLGTTGCFSMQVTKNFCCGDGGAVLTSDDAIADRIYKIHSNGRAPSTDSGDFHYDPLHAGNYRMTGFQAAILLAQLPFVAEYAKTRNDNALYLSSLLKDIPGVCPQKIYDGGTSAWHLYMFRIIEEEFGCSRDKVVEALSAEDISCSAGYSTGDWTNYVKSIYSTPAAKRVYSDQALNDWTERTSLPNLEKLCAQAVWFSQTQMLSERSNMDAFADALRRIQQHAGELR